MKSNSHKITFLANVSSLHGSFTTNQTVDVDEAIAADMVNAGHAKRVDQTPADYGMLEVETTKPGDKVRSFKLVPASEVPAAAPVKRARKTKRKTSDTSSSSSDGE